MGGDEERIREGGCQAYLSKPISVPKFIETIRRFLGVGQSMPAVRRSRQAERRRRQQNVVFFHNFSLLRASGNAAFHRRFRQRMPDAKPKAQYGTGTTQSTLAANRV
jgi:hypothetical protein